MLYQVKAGILGLEDLGGRYAHLLKDHIKYLSLIGAAGRTQKELLFAKNELSLEYVYSDEKSLIENHDIDAICIFGDPRRRPHLAISAIEAGKHVFMADPIALNVEDAIAVDKSAQRRPSQVVMVSSYIRFVALLQVVKQVIDNGDIGVINHISLDSAFFDGMNRRFSMNSGSAFLDSALDELDLCSWLMDTEFTEVKVSKNNNTIICEAKTNQTSSVNLIVQTTFKKEQSYFNIYGNKGQIVVSNTNKRSFKLYKDTGDKVDIYHDDYHGFNFPEYLQLHHFAQAILGQQKKKVGTAHAVDIVKLAVALEKSSVLSQAITL